VGTPCIEVVILGGKHALDIQLPKESSDNFKPTGAMRIKAQIPEKHATAGEALFLKQERNTSGRVGEKRSAWLEHCRSEFAYYDIDV
jgi:hypothetical protein